MHVRDGEEAGVDDKGHCFDVQPCSQCTATDRLNQEKARDRM